MMFCCGHDHVDVCDVLHVDMITVVVLPVDMITVMFVMSCMWA